MNKFCTNCGAPLPEPPSHAVRNTIVIVSLALLLPLACFFAILYAFGSRITSLSDSGDLSAAVAKYAFSYYSLIEESVETATGDDFTVTLADAYSFFPCESSCDGTCFGRDHSDQTLRLSYQITSNVHPDFSHTYDVNVSIIDGSLDDTPTLDSDSYLKYLVELYQADYPGSIPSTTVPEVRSQENTPSTPAPESATLELYSALPNDLNHV